jgi:hypothetical protein
MINSFSVCVLKLFFLCFVAAKIKVKEKKSQALFFQIAVNPCKHWEKKFQKGLFECVLIVH